MWITLSSRELIPAEYQHTLRLGANDKPLIRRHLVCTLEVSPEHQCLNVVDFWSKDSASLYLSDLLSVLLDKIVEPRNTACEDFTNI
jgi:hypothetical protein